MILIPEMNMSNISLLDMRLIWRNLNFICEVVGCEGNTGVFSFHGSQNSFLYLLFPNWRIGSQLNKY